MRSKREQALEVFGAWQGRLACPVCAAPLHADDTGLTCPARHHFDLSAKGSVQLLAGGGGKALYDAALFAGRGRMLSRGMFDPLTAAVAAWLREAGAVHWLDAGCGEAVLTAGIHALAGGLPLGMDIARPAVEEASRRFGGRLALVRGDVRRPPVMPGTLDAVVNLFTPADYGAFAAALKPDGWLIKAVPGPDHLAQLRDRPAGRAETIERIEAGFRKHCGAVEVKRLRYDFAVDASDYEALSVMSPVSAHMRPQTLERLRSRACQAVTVDALALRGQMRRDVWAHEIH